MYTKIQQDNCVHYGMEQAWLQPDSTVMCYMQGAKKKEEKNMTTKFYLDGKKTTRKAVKELVGDERLKRMLAEAKETFFEDPLTQNSFYLGRNGMLTIEFA